MRTISDARVSLLRNAISQLTKLETLARSTYSLSTDDLVEVKDRTVIDCKEVIDMLTDLADDISMDNYE